MNPSQNTQAQESHISKMRGVYVYVHVFTYTSEGGKEVLKHRRLELLKVILLSKRESEKMTKRNGLRDKS